MVHAFSQEEKTYRRKKYVKMQHCDADKSLMEQSVATNPTIKYTVKLGNTRCCKECVLNFIYRVQEWGKTNATVKEDEKVIGKTPRLTFMKGDSEITCTPRFDPDGNG